MPFFSFSTSANNLLLETKAISMPEKKAEKAIDTNMPMMIETLMLLLSDQRY